MALSESGSPSLYHSEDPPETADQPFGRGDHPKRDDALFWLWLTPVYLGVAGFVLYVLYALGFI
jgi:hypothetical protein